MLVGLAQVLGGQKYLRGHAEPPQPSLLRERVFGMPRELAIYVGAIVGLLPVAGLPRFNGGAVGYLSYEAVASFERLPVPEQTHPLHASLPLAAFMYAEDLLAFDHPR